MDLALQAAGENGKFQKILSLIVIIVGGLTLFTGLSFPFMTYSPIMLCREKSNYLQNYEDCHKSQLCKYNIYDIIVDTNNSVKNFSYEFELYCDKAYYIPIIGTCFFAGGIASSLLLSPIPDAYGREKIYKILIFAAAFLHFNILIASSPIHILITNFLLGFVAYAYTMSSFIITEYIDRKNAALVMSINNAIFPIFGIFTAIFFIFINNWRILFFITSTIMTITAIMTKKYFIESPRWLSSKNKISECMEAVEKIAEINGRTQIFKKFLSENQELFSYNVNDVKEVKESLNIIQIIKFPSQRKKIFILCYMWFCAGFCFYGLILNIEHLGGNLFTDSIVTFAGEAISEIVSGYLADEFGRIIVLKISGFLGGFGFIFYELVSEESKNLRTILVFLSSFGFSGVFNLLFIYTPETFPTSIRSTVMGILYLLSRIGALFVPSVVSIVSRSNFVFGFASILSGYLCFQLKETLGEDIDDDIPELGNRKSYLSSFKNSIRLTGPAIKSMVSDKYFNFSP